MDDNFVEECIQTQQESLLIDAIKSGKYGGKDVVAVLKTVAR